MGASLSRQAEAEPNAAAASASASTRTSDAPPATLALAASGGAAGAGVPGMQQMGGQGEGTDAGAGAGAPVTSGGSRATPAGVVADSGTSRRPPCTPHTPALAATPSPRLDGGAGAGEPTPESGFGDLPDELWEHVLGYVDGAALAALAQCTARLHELINTRRNAAIRWRARGAGYQRGRFAFVAALGPPPPPPTPDSPGDTCYARQMWHLPRHRMIAVAATQAPGSGGGGGYAHGGDRDTHTLRLWHLGPRDCESSPVCFALALPANGLARTVPLRPSTVAEAGAFIVVVTWQGQVGVWARATGFGSGGREGCVAVRRVGGYLQMPAECIGQRLWLAEMHCVPDTFAVGWKGTQMYRTPQHTAHAPRGPCPMCCKVEPCR